ncbi:hypothetical protein C8Q70DRAFT_933936 [Cubamyces menziesii]|nr:hypothetical protein C8Q70DRAFT_933936 [Cubamyces menziesii]
MSPLLEEFEPYELAEKLLRSLWKGLDQFSIERASSESIVCIENVEQKVAQCRAALRSELNKRKPLIHRLPTELLGKIFLSALPSYGRDLSDDHQEGPDMEAERRVRMLITQVCGRWRAIALGIASFWGVIDMTSPRWSFACFERSRVAPLNVFARYPLYGTVGTPLGTHSARIRELFIEIPYEERGVVPTELPAILPPVPNLECLTFATRCDPWRGGRPAIDFEPRPRIFPYPPLCLKKLVLNHPCWIPSGIPLAQLTHLYLSEGTDFALHKLLTFLGQCSALQELILVDVHIANILAVPDNFSVELPRLRLLTLGVTHARYSLGCLLRGIVLPPTVVVRVFGVEGVRALSDMEPRPSLPFTAGFDTLVVQQSQQGLTIQAGVWASYSTSTSFPALFLQFQGKRYASQHELTQHLLALLIPLYRIQYVIITAERCDLATNLLPRMPQVTVLRIVEPESEARDSYNAADRLCTALHHAMIRFPSAAFEVWTTRQRASIQLPVFKAKRTYYEIISEEGGKGRVDTVTRSPNDHESGVHKGSQYGDDWEMIEVSGRFVIHTSGGSTFKIYGTSLDRQKIFMIPTEANKKKKRPSYYPDLGA